LSKADFVVTSEVELLLDSIVIRSSLGHIDNLDSADRHILCRRMCHIPVGMGII
jgi:hypothetical protein